MTNLTSRAEFRVILKGVVSCLKQNLDKPGLPVLTAEEIHFWLHEVTLDDARFVVAQIDAERAASPAAKLPGIVK
jgi:hypothetical protein